MKFEYDLSVHCGNTDDCFDKLKSLCKSEAEKLRLTIEIGSDSIIEIPFWTEDFPELICVGKFSKDENGGVKYKLDFSEFS